MYGMFIDSFVTAVDPLLRVQYVQEIFSRHESIPGRRRRQWFGIFAIFHFQHFSNARLSCIPMHNK
jgi:hypothetical protein